MAIRRRRRSAGRKRKEGEREPNGRISRKSSEVDTGSIPVYAIAQRASAADCSFDVARVRPEPGYALGQLLLRGIICQSMHDAGLRLEQDWIRWARMAGLPSHQQRTPSGGKTPPEPTGEEWAEAKKRFEDVQKTLAKVQPSRLVWSCLETVIMDGVTRHIIHGQGASVARKAFIDGMTALSVHYRICDGKCKDCKKEKEE